MGCDTQEWRQPQQLGIAKDYALWEHAILHELSVDIGVVDGDCSPPVGAEVH